MIIGDVFSRLPVTPSLRRIYEVGLRRIESVDATGNSVQLIQNNSNKTMDNHRSDADQRRRIVTTDEQTNEEHDDNEVIIVEYI